MTNQPRNSETTERLERWARKLGESLQHPPGFHFGHDDDGNILMTSSDLYVKIEAGDTPGTAWVLASFVRASHPVPRERRQEVGIFYQEQVDIRDENTGEVASDIREVLRYPMATVSDIR